MTPTPTEAPYMSDLFPRAIDWLVEVPLTYLIAIVVMLVIYRAAYIIIMKTYAASKPASFAAAVKFLSADSAALQPSPETGGTPPGHPTSP